MPLALGTSVAGQVADTVGDVLAQRLVETARQIGDAARTLQVNRDMASAMSRRVDELLVVVTTELDVDPDAGDFGRFVEILADTQTVLNDIQRQGYLAQLLYKDRDARKLSDLSQRIRETLEIVKMGTRADMHASVSQAVENALARNLPLPDPVATSVATPASAPQLPARPQIYLGRAHETQRIVDALTTEHPAYVAIIGLAGVGKSVLSAAVLHDPAVVAHYDSSRYFVACDAMDGRSTCLINICSAFGIAKPTRRAAQASLVEVLKRGKSLLVLDNFESAWEAPSARDEAEETLAFLATIEGLTLLITMRGAERPQRVAWTRPLLPPLSPLDDNAAKQLFVSISDISENDPRLQTLLGYLDNVPLPLVLMANLAQYESSYDLMRRWERVKTAMLQRSGGNDRLTSLDVSIELSLASPRVAQDPGAVTLLGLLSLLPQGAMDADVRAFASSGAASSLSCLLRTSLAFRSPDERVRVLAPIREFMLANHAPTETAASGLYSHYFTLAELLTHVHPTTTNPQAVAAVSPEVENIQSVVHYALDHASDLRPAVSAGRGMVVLLTDTGIGSLDLLHHALRISRACTFNDLTADLLYYWGTMAYNSVADGAPEKLFGEALTFHQLSGNDRGIIDSTCALARFLPSEDAIVSLRSLIPLAESRGDTVQLARIHQTLAGRHENLWNLSAARASWQQAARILQPLGTSMARLLGNCMNHMADIDLDQCNLPAAIAQLNASITVLEEAQSRLLLAQAHKTLGICKLVTGCTSDSVNSFDSALSNCQGSHALMELQTLECLVGAHLTLGSTAAAEQAAGRAQELVHSVGPRLGPYGRIFSLRIQGDLMHANGNLLEAIALFSAAVIANHELPPERLPLIEAITLRMLGQVLVNDNNFIEARRCLVTSLVILSKATWQRELLTTLVYLAPALEDNQASESLLNALMPALFRFNFQHLLADALLSSATIALWRGHVADAESIARRALTTCEATKNERGRARVVAFLHQLA